MLIFRNVLWGSLFKLIPNNTHNIYFVQKMTQIVYHFICAICKKDRYIPGSMYILSYKTVYHLQAI